MPVIGMCHNIKNTGIEGAKLNAKDCHIQELFEKANRSAIWVWLKKRVWIVPRVIRTYGSFGSPAFWYGSWGMDRMWYRGMDRNLTL